MYGLVPMYGGIDKHILSFMFNMQLVLLLFITHSKVLLNTHHPHKTK